MLLTNQARVLLAIARDCDVRLSDIAREVGITERAAHRIVCELTEAGLVSRSKNGRRNCYEVLDRGGAENEEVAELASLLATATAARS